MTYEISFRNLVAEILFGPVQLYLFVQPCKGCHNINLLMTTNENGKAILGTDLEINQGAWLAQVSTQLGLSFTYYEYYIAPEFEVRV